MKTVRVETGRPYDILIERGLIKKCGSIIKTITSAVRIAVITDSNVSPIYSETVKNSLKEAGFAVTVFAFEAGEQSKNIETICHMYDCLADNNFTRHDMIVALGGGVTGDMAGFAAATFLRGIEFVQIPTSLLAQVDSSVGGKTGFDIKQGKNLVGAFWQPSLVIIDPDTIDTLPKHFISDGMAEVIKYGCIKDKEFFNFLKNEDALEDIDEVIYKCVKIKRDVVSADEHEKGERMLLNFGHTLGHALEKLGDFKTLSHGEAVAIGMVMMTAASEKAGLTKGGTCKKIAKVCRKYGLPIENPAKSQDIALAALTDKKSSGNSINLVLISELGKSFVKKIPHEELAEFIKVD